MDGRRQVGEGRRAALIYPKAALEHLPGNGSPQRVLGLQGRVDQTQGVQTRLQEPPIGLLVTQQLQLRASLVHNRQTEGGRDGRGG